MPVYFVVTCQNLHWFSLVFIKILKALEKPNNIIVSIRCYLLISLWTTKDDCNA